jgi:hypothetical protein
LAALSACGGGGDAGSTDTSVSAQMKRLIIPVADGALCAGGRGGYTELDGQCLPASDALGSITSVRRATAATSVITADAFFTWAQGMFAAFFNGGTGATITANGYVYRVYSSGNAIAVTTATLSGLAPGAVFILGPLTGNVLLNVGSLSGFNCTVAPSNCGTTTPGGGNASTCLVDGSTAQYPNAKVCYTGLAQPFTCDAAGLKSSASGYLAVTGATNYTYTPVASCPAGVTSGLLSALTTVTGPGTVSTLAGTAVAATTFAGVEVDGSATAARFYFAASSTSSGAGITSDGASLYVVDSGHYAIRKVDITTGAVTTLAGTPAGVAHPFGFSGGHADGIGTAAVFSAPNGITIDPSKKNLYVADGRYLRKIAIASGQVSTVVNFSFTNAVTRATEWFNASYGVATDGTSVYLLDSQLPHTPAILRKIDLATNAVSNVPLTGAALESTMQSITLDGGNLYVAGGATVKKIDLTTNVVTQLAGDTSVAAVSRDGMATAATFTLKNEGIASDGTYLYVTDGGVIRRVALATGVVSTYAGTTNGYADGTGPGVKFQGLGGITLVGGVLYATDNLSAIRKIQ